MTAETTPTSIPEKSEFKELTKRLILFHNTYVYGIKNDEQLQQALKEMKEIDTRIRKIVEDPNKNKNFLGYFCGESLHRNIYGKRAMDIVMALLLYESTSFNVQGYMAKRGNQ